MEDYGFYVWADPESSDFMKELLQDLRNAIWALKKEMNRGVANEVVDSTMQHGLDVEKMNHFL